MKKRTLVSFLLALVMCLSLLPMTALAAGNVSLDKTSYQEGETVTVTVSGITDEMKALDPYVGIYEKGAAANTYKSGLWSRVDVGTKEYGFDKFLSAGEYEMRLYRKTYASDSDLITSVSFTVTSIGGAGSISLDNTVYQAGSTITVAVTGITVSAKALDPYVGIYEKGAAASAYNAVNQWERVDEGSGAHTFTAPKKNGEYEARLYRRTSASDSDLIMSVPFTITGGTSTGYDEIPTDSLEGADLNAVGNYNWAGKWEDSNYGEIIITQNGSVVTGNYPWDNGRITATAQGNMLYGQWAESPSYLPPNDGGDFEFVMSEDGMSFIGHSRYGSADGWRTWNGKRILESSDWATEEIEEAYQLGLIPDALVGADLTQDITRAEFAAVAVKAYEALSGTAAIPVVNNPFTDTKDVEVLKAYNIGAVNGTSATTFAPNALLNREQAATMLTRVFKRITLSGWTLATDSEFTLPYTKPAAFADDKDISGWAKDSVYFMVANDIIKGVGNNKFAPKNTTSSDEATGYANATREQALIIAVRMVQNLGK